MFTLHCRYRNGWTMMTLRYRSGSKAWRAMQLNRQDGWIVRFYGPNGFIPV